MFTREKKVTRKRLYGKVVEEKSGGGGVRRGKKKKKTPRMRFGEIGWSSSTGRIEG